MPIDAVRALRPHRPGAADGEAGADHRVEEGVPAGAGGAVVAVALGLLEGVVDGDREGRVRLLGEAVHRLRHAVEEERLGLLLAAVAVGRGDQFLGLGHGERGEEVGEDGLQRAAQPDVEEVREVGVADVVVVGRIGGDDLVRAERLRCGIRLRALSRGRRWRAHLEHFATDSIDADEVCRRLAEADSPQQSPRPSESLVAQNVLRSISSLGIPRDRSCEP